MRESQTIERDGSIGSTRDLERPRDTGSVSATGSSVNSRGNAGFSGWGLASCFQSAFEYLSLGGKGLTGPFLTWFPVRAFAHPSSSTHTHTHTHTRLYVGGVYFGFKCLAKRIFDMVSRDDTKYHALRFCFSPSLHWEIVTHVYM